VVQVWDTAGSERFKCLTKLYYREAFAAIVCYDLTDAESWKHVIRCRLCIVSLFNLCYGTAQVKFWVNELVQNEPVCRIVFCGTKQDLIEQGGLGVRQVSAAEVADFADQLNLARPYRPRMYETSSKSGYNVDEVFHQV